MQEHLITLAGNNCCCSMLACLFIMGPCTASLQASLGTQLHTAQHAWPSVVLAVMCQRHQPSNTLPCPSAAPIHIAVAAGIEAQ